MQVRFLEPAQYELDDAVNYYNAQAPNLGQSFLLEVLTSLDRICLWPDAWHQVSINTRRCQLKRFPYGIIYSKVNNTILVIAIGHLHRRPEYWLDIKSRLTRK